MTTAERTNHFSTSEIVYCQEMSLDQMVTCGLVLREHLGEVTEKVGVYLMRKGATPMGLIAKDTELPLEQVIVLPVQTVVSQCSQFEYLWESRFLQQPQCIREQRTVCFSSGEESSRHNDSPQHCPFQAKSFGIC